MFVSLVKFADNIEMYITSSDSDDADDKIKEIFSWRLKSPPLNLVLELSEDDKNKPQNRQVHLKLRRPGRIFTFSSTLEAH